MYKITVNEHKEYTIETKQEGLLLNGEAIDWDLVEPGSGEFHILYKGRSFNARLVSFDGEAKSMVLRVNGNDYTLNALDQYDMLLDKLGMAGLGEQKINDIKAPMPGLVLDIVSQAGQVIAKGDTLLILEAMKMENVLKSPGAGTVKSIKVAKGDTVEKGQILVEFD